MLGFGRDLNSQLSGTKSCLSHNILKNFFGHSDILTVFDSTCSNLVLFGLLGCLLGLVGRVLGLILVRKLFFGLVQEGEAERVLDADGRRVDDSGNKNKHTVTV